MRSEPNLASVLFAVVCLSLVSIDGAHAYIDPGTGSYILQLLIGGSVAAVFLVKMYWQKLLAVFSKNNTNTNKPEGGDEE